MNVSKTSPVHYSEHEAAQELGVSIQQLRTLVQRHIMKPDEELPLIPVASFQPADLLLLRFLAGKNSAQ